MKELKDYIVVMNNIMPPSLADTIISEYKESSDWIEATIRAGVDLNIRNCQTIGLSFSNIIDKNKEIRQKIDHDLYAVASQALKEYARRFLLDSIKKDSGYELLKYEIGGFYTQHTDSVLTNPRTVYCSFILNDDFEGGEFAFFDRELNYKLKKGSCIMFPSNFMYPHEVLPVTKGTRYSIITWFI